MWGMPELGAFGFQLREVPGDRRIVTTTRSHSNKLVTDCVDAMEPHEVVRVGGAGNKIIQLVEGKASAYVFASPGCKKWDRCTPETILHAVGGKLTDMHGNAYCYDANVKHMNSAGVLATLRNHEYYVSRVPQSVLQALNSPFTAYNQKELAEKIKEGKFERIPDRYSEELNTLLCKMLDPEEYMMPPLEYRLLSRQKRDAVHEAKKRAKTLIRRLLADSDCLNRPAEAIPASHAELGELREQALQDCKKAVDDWKWASLDWGWLLRYWQDALDIRDNRRRNQRQQAMRDLAGGA